MSYSITKCVNPEDLPPRQREVFEYIRKYVAENGESPLWEQMQRAMGMRSAGSLRKHLDALVRKGFLVRTPGKSKDESGIVGDGKVRLWFNINDALDGEPADQFF